LSARPALSYRYLLDTNIVSDLVRNPLGAVTRRIARVGEDRVCTSIIVACELRYGAEKKGSTRLTAQLEQILSVLPVLPLDGKADRQLRQDPGGSRAQGHADWPARHPHREPCPGERADSGDEQPERVRARRETEAGQLAPVDVATRREPPAVKPEALITGPERAA